MKYRIHVIEKSKLINGLFIDHSSSHSHGYCSDSLKQEIHDLRQKIELQTVESDENQNSVRRRFQDAVTELTSQVEALSKGKSR